MIGSQAPKGVPTVFDPSFTGAGKQPGLEIWRVEKMAVVKKAPSDKAYKGHLFQGDSYIILETKVGLRMNHCGGGLIDWPVYRLQYCLFYSHIF